VSEEATFLEWLTGALRRAGIPYMVCGSVSSTYYGEYRATNDVDVVIEPTEAALEEFVRTVGRDCYVNAATALEALRHRSMFNVIHLSTAWKADLIVRKNRPYSLEEFRRRREVDFRGLRLSIASPEDVILSKLEWARAAESPQQYRDALGVALLQWQELDVPYLRRWAAELGLTEPLDHLLEETRRGQPPE